MAVELALLKKKGQAFEDLFTDAAKQRWGPDFERWQPQGKLGDLKCDGYLVPEKTVFQSYGPKRPEPRKTSTKIRTDFEGAKAHFGEDMEKWVFVHNQNGPSAECGALLKELRRENSKVKISFWDHNDVLEFMMQLDPNKLTIVFPELLSIGDDDVSEERNLDVSVVADLAASRAPNNDGGADRLNQALAELGADDFDIRRRILGSSVWLDPLPIARGVSLLKEKGYDDPAISSNLDRLKNQGFVQVTSAHILPKDRDVCQEAADILADEFIDLLGTQ